MNTQLNFTYSFMKTFKLFFVAIAFLAPVALSAQTVKERDWHWTDLKNGIETGYLQDTLWGQPRYIAVVKYDPRIYGTFLLDSEKENAKPTNILAAQVGARGAVNGSYFNVRQRTPVTFFSINGTVYGETSPDEEFRSNGLLIIKDKKGHKVSIQEYDAKQKDKLAARNYGVLASGPILLKNGARCTGEDKGGFATGLHNRTVIGKDPEGKIWMMVVDGRYAGICYGMSISMLTTLCQELGLVDALNLDGGGSSQIWTSVQGTLNHPSDNGVFDREGGRRVPNIVYFK